jgi:hypothetical protein
LDDYPPAVLFDKVALVSVDETIGESSLSEVEREKDHRGNRASAVYVHPNESV